jgi:excisionase family DNA binding protein
MSMEKQLPPLPLFRDLTELGEELGLNNLNSLYEEIKEGKINAFKFGKSYKLTQEEFDRVLEEKTKKPEPMYDLGDLAGSLNVSMQYLYMEVRKKRLKVLKVGKSYKVRPEEWQRWLESKKSLPNEENSDDDEE